MTMVLADVAAARTEVLQFRQGAWELLYTATKFGDASSIALAKQQLLSADVRWDALSNIEALIRALGG